MARTKKSRRTQQTSSPSANNGSPSSGFFSHDSALRVIGFAADMIAIGTVLFAIKTEMVLKALPFILSPWILFPIWIMAAYTYLCMLHSHWEKNREGRKWSKMFKAFVVGDLIFRFRSPYLMIPALLLAITFVWIAKSTDILAYVLIPLGVISLFTLMTSPMWGESFKANFISPHDQEEDIKKRQEWIDEENRKRHRRIDTVNSRWEELSSIIEKKIGSRSYIQSREFQELFYVWGLDEESMHYAFAKYAAEHPGQAHFGNLHQKGTQAVGTNLLIITDNLDREKFQIVL